MAKTIDGRLAYADLLRTLAIFAVLILHLCGSQLGGLSVYSSSWNVLNLYDGLTHWCVPVFILLSGMFMLDPKRSLTLPKLFFHHILRMVVALVFWGTAYGALGYVLAGGRLSWSGLGAALKGVLWGNSHYHLWFLYMMIGLYLLTPILRAFVKGAGRREFHYCFVFIFFAAYVLPTVLQFRPSQTVSTYVGKLMLPTSLLLAYIGLFLAGYYLKTFTLSRLAEAILYLLGVAGAAVTVLGTALLSQRAGVSNFLLYNYNSPNVLFMSLAVFVLFRYVLGVSEERGRSRRVGAVAQLSFGIYLVHDMFLMLLRQAGITPLSLPPAIGVPLLAVVVFLPSLAVAWLISKIPLLGRYLG